MIGAFLEWLARHATKLLAGAVFLGLAIPPLADLLRPGLTTFVVVNLVVALLRLDLTEVRSYLNRPYLIGANIVFLLLICPVAVSLIMQPFGLPPGLHAAVVLMAAAPPIMSAAAFALLLGLDAALAIFVVVATHAIVPFTLPVMALWLLGMELDIGVAELMLRLGLVIGIAFAIAFVIRKWLVSEAFLVRNARRIDGLAVIGLVYFATAIMAGVTEFAIAQPGYVLLTVTLAFVANAALQAFGAVAFWKVGRRPALTVGLMAGNCNMGILLATLVDTAPMDLVIYFAIAQLPMYMLPLFALPIYRRVI